MAVTVLIKRVHAPGSSKQLFSLYEQMKTEALRWPGYLGSEVLWRVDVDNQMLVISHWAHVDDWSTWLVSPERRRIQEQIDLITSDDTKFEIYAEQERG